MTRTNGSHHQFTLIKMDNYTVKSIILGLVLGSLLSMSPSARLAQGEQNQNQFAHGPVVATFSIVACDLEQREWGIAVQSRVLAVGSLVPFGEAEVGAIATQSLANLTYGPRGLELLKRGYSAEEVVSRLVDGDLTPELRQVAIVDAQGRVANHTGEACFEWAGAVTGKNYSCQGNILTGKEVVQAMATTFENNSGSLVDRLIASLQAGQDAGGDRRGQQSAAILVLKRRAGYGGFNDRMFDLRVDDHQTPITELKRLVALSKKYR